MKINLLSPKSFCCLSKSIFLRLLLFVSVILGTQANAQSVSIASSDPDNIICTGTSVTFTATPVDEGTTVSYQWYVGTTPFGTDSDTFITSALTNGQTVSVVMTSDDVDYTSDNTITTVVSAAPSTSDAGSDITQCNISTFTLSGNTPTVGTGLWTVTNGTATISSPSSPTSGVTGVTSGSSATLTWTIGNGSCTDSNSSVVLTNTALPSTSDAGDNITQCDTETFTLAGNEPTVGTGLWTVTSGTATITSPSSPTSEVTGVTSGSSATLTWTIGNGSCTASTSSVVLTNTALPSTSDAGSDITQCNTSTFTLSGNTPTVGTGLWTVTSGTATISSPSSPTSGVTGVTSGSSATLTWTISNGSCTASTSSVVLTNNALPLTSDAGSDITQCDTETFTLAGNEPTVGTGLWTVTSGTATITDPSSPTSGVTDITAGSSATLTWTISNYSCTASTSTVVLTNTALPSTSDAGSDITQCATSTFTLAGNEPTVGSGLWTVTSGTATITSPTSPTSEVTGVTAGSSATLTWTISNDSCTASTSSVVLTNVPISVAGTISGEATVCSGNNDTVLTLEDSIGTIQWQSSDSLDGTFSDITDATSATFTANDLTATTYYQAVVKSGVCDALTSTPVAITVNPVSVAGTISGEATVCSGNNDTVLTLEDSIGTIQWQSSDTLDGTYSDITDATAATYTATDLTATTYYQAVAKSGVCDAVTSTPITITVNAAPNAGTDGVLTVCAGTSPTEAQLFAQLGGNPDIGGIWSNQGLVYTYTVDAVEPCTVAATATVTITERAVDAGHVSGISSDETNDYLFENNITVCSGNNDISLTVISSYGNIQWMYSVSATGASRNLWGQTSNTLVLPKNRTGNTTTYYFAKVSCATDVYTNKIVVTVLKSIAGKITGAGAVCSGGTKTLTLGTHAGTVQWQSSSTDSINDSDWTDVGVFDSSSFTTPALTASTYYRVKVVNGSCDLSISPSVAVNISQPALSGTLSGTNNNVCYGNGTSLEVVGTSGIIKWQKSTNYIAAPLVATWTTIANTTTTPIAVDGFGGSTLGTGYLKVSTAYRVQITSGACVSYSDVPYVVTVIPVAKAGTISTPKPTVCLDGSITFSLTGSVGTLYQWQSSASSSTAVGSTWNNVGTGATYDATASSLSSLYVRCIVSNSCTNATTAVKTILVDKPSVPGIISGGGTVCSNAISTLKLASYTGTIQWEFSTGGVYAVVPYLKSGIYMNPSNASTFETTTSTGKAATYIITNVTADTYFRAKITSGQCSSEYSSTVLYQKGTQAIAGTISALSSSICYGSSTTLALAGSTGTIVWQKSTNYLTLSDPSLATWSTLTGTTSSVSTGNLSASTAYRAKVTIGTCSTLYSTIYTVTVNKAVAKSITKGVTSPSGNTSTTQLCNNFSTFKSLTVGIGYVGDITWQHSIDNTNWTTIEGATSASYIIDVASIGANYYRAKFSAAPCSPDAYSPSALLYYKSCVARMGDTGINEATPDLTDPVFSVVAYPNPSSTIFTLELLSPNKGKSIEFKAYDIIGRLIEQRQIQQAGPVEVGADYSPGIYNIVVSQGTKVKTLRLIKK